MRARGARAYADNKAITDHGMNHGTAAIADWQAGWLAAWQPLEFHHAPASTQRIDARQVGV
ncbi:hypothetical protein BN2497_2579 [Janthinobacterium sp. CG23_2]|nr:hypothetical protein BN2497_2579 [Janthinobacterium sp. CG23_2]CUU27687.1 hypothetical protein BN3177_2579 [Janthinobacterium sp. CG23_2]